MATLSSRFRDPGGVGPFYSNFLVECPRCRKCTQLIFKHEAAQYQYACTACGFNEKRPSISGPRYLYTGNWHERLGLWLQTESCGNVLWAANAEHLTFLEDYVGAKLRERRQTEYGWSNKSMASRLPQWITSAKNRDEVLRGIERLKRKLADQTRA